MLKIGIYVLLVTWIWIWCAFTLFYNLSVAKKKCKNNIYGYHNFTMEMLLAIWNLGIIIIIFLLFSNNSTTVSLVVSNCHDIETTKPTNRIEVLSQTLYLTHWYQAGVRQILNLFDSQEGCFLPGFRLFLSARNSIWNVTFHNIIVFFLPFL